MKKIFPLIFLILISPVNSRANDLLDFSFFGDFEDVISGVGDDIIKSLPDIDIMDGGGYISDGVDKAENFLNVSEDRVEHSAYFSDFYTLYDEKTAMRVGVSNSDNEYQIRIVVKSEDLKSLRTIYSSTERPIIMLTDENNKEIKFTLKAKKLLDYNNTVYFDIEYPNNYLGKYINILFKGREFYTARDFIITVPIRRGKILILD